MAVSNTNIRLNDSLISQYKAEYAQTNCIFFPGLLTGEALQSIIKKLSGVRFETKVEMDQKDKFGKVLFVPQAETVLFTFNFLFNNSRLFSALEEITGCGTIGNFTGRIHRSEEGANHGIDWHGDNSDTRLLAMTLGLGEDRYTGGQFQIRKKGNVNLLAQFGQIEAGDALIFRIAPELEHRLSILETGRRTVGVGWFRSQPDQRTHIEHYLKTRL